MKKTIAVLLACLAIVCCAGCQKIRENPTIRATVSVAENVIEDFRGFFAEYDSQEPEN